MGWQGCGLADRCCGCFHALLSRGGCGSNTIAEVVLGKARTRDGFRSRGCGQDALVQFPEVRHVGLIRIGEDFRRILLAADEQPAQVVELLLGPRLNQLIEQRAVVGEDRRDAAPLRRS